MMIMEPVEQSESAAVQKPRSFEAARVGASAELWLQFWLNAAATGMLNANSVLKTRLYCHADTKKFMRFDGDPNSVDYQRSCRTILELRWLDVLGEVG